tara:strand:+ start:4438 stop:5526 length:1089 start_codon:yes stop_codon:yes gene_type:complete
MSVPLFDLRRVIHPHASSLRRAFESSLETCHFINGPAVTDWEADLDDYLGAGKSLGISSGTDALLAIFMALGLEPGSEILVTSFTFVASATSIVRAGLKPVFVDTAPQSFHPGLEEYAAAMTTNTKAVLLVHIFGAPNNMAEMVNFCKTNDLLLIEDCAQSLGAEWEGQKIGTFGDASAFSFFPAKNLGCFGDGGAVSTPSTKIYETIKAIRSHGAKTKYHTEMMGGNFRLDTIQASILSVLLPALSGWLSQRGENALYYLEHINESKSTQLPENLKGHSWNQFTLRSSRRDALKIYLDENNIGNAVYYPIPLHKQPLFATTTTQCLPNVEKLCKEVLSLPIYPGLTRDEQIEVVDKINCFK